METADRYRWFGQYEARGASPCHEAWSLGVAGDGEVLARIDSLPARERQPNLVFAAARFAGLAPGPYAAFRDELLSRWDEVRAITATHRTQTNEAGRCAVLLPVLTQLDGPLALIEVGASAGLCLYPDRYAYAYDDRPVLSPTGVSGGRGAPPILPCATTGPVPFPSELPQVVWRAGIDLNPLDVGDDDDVRWLETLVWPE